MVDRLPIANHPFARCPFGICAERTLRSSNGAVRRQNYRGERWIVLENPFSNQFFRLRPAAYEFVARLRPDCTVQEAWQQCLNRFPDEAPGQEAVIQLLSQYATLGTAYAPASGCVYSIGSAGG